MRHPYFDTVQLIERLHRHFLEVIKADLDRMNIQDINNVQALILYNISTEEMTVGELTARGYYLGSNVSYNVNKMFENGYLERERSQHDRRSMRVKLSAKGLELQTQLQALFDRHVSLVDKAQLDNDSLLKSNDTLKKLERFWTSMLNYTGA